MILEKTFYALCCDNCKRIVSKYDDDETGYWSDRDVVKDVSCDAYEEINGKQLCLDCFEYDDDGKVIIATSRENKYIKELEL